jgi:hypothetical protein
MEFALNENLELARAMEMPRTEADDYGQDHWKT